ncbi:transcriptional regulator, TetR family [Propionispira arboris]|uniref:Transcriptional regulator, TetR family n=1 Tax=Propionispira arboris TaxID=84035 RepID=A0A1H6XVX4_9FIRM|nr:transcriptional regulator, TetR family [Propionispira arboris]
MRDQILMAAAEEMKNRGVKFTMSDLAKRLSLSKTSLYEHFSSKRELVHDILFAAIQDTKQQETEIYNSKELSPLEKIKALLEVSPRIFGPINNYSIYDDLCHYYPEEWKMVLGFIDKQSDRLALFVIHGIEVHAIRKVNVPVLKHLIASVIDAFLSQRFLEQNNMTNADALAAMADIIVYGLNPSKK